MVTASVALVVVLVGFAFAGSQSALAAGTTIAGVDVGGLSERQAVRVLTARATVVEQTPVVFTAKGETFALSASQLGVAADWQVAVREAREAGGSGLSGASGVFMPGFLESKRRRRSVPTTRQ